MTKKHFEAAARQVRGMRDRRQAVVVRDFLVALFGEFNPRFDADRFRTACAIDADRLMADETDRGELVGTCPACRESVFANEPDGPVWTCPADLADTNPFHEPRMNDATDEEWEAVMKRTGVYSNCLEDYDRADGGGHCYERLPLHSACYERGNY